LLKICAHRIDGQSDTADKRITSALGIQDPRPQIEFGDKRADVLKCQARGTAGRTETIRWLCSVGWGVSPRV